MATDTFSLSRMTQMHLLLVRQLYDVVVACSVTQYTYVRRCVHVCASVYSVFVIHCQNAVNSRNISGNVDIRTRRWNGCIVAGCGLPRCESVSHIHSMYSPMC